MKILAIESSCDETSAAVVEDGVKVLSNVIASQAGIHAKTGGVVPEVAAREHVAKIMPVVEKALKEAKCTLAKIDAIAVTYGPGLAVSLVVGTSVANILSLVFQKPLIAVNHIYGHVYATWLEAKRAPQFPLISLSVSGGHNELFLMKEHHDFTVLGETADDAAGEAFDKVARLLGLPYPGGPVIEKLAQKGNAFAFTFPKATFSDGRCDFSFSGLKTAVLYHMERNKRKKSDKKFLADTAASFQHAVIDALTSRLFAAVALHPDVREIHMTGGVSANMTLRAAVERMTAAWNKQHGAKVVLRAPARLSYCTDNAAMIGAAAYFQYQANPHRYKEFHFVGVRAAF